MKNATIPTAVVLLAACAVLAGSTPGAKPGRRA